MDGASGVEEIVGRLVLRFPSHLVIIKRALPCIEELCAYYGCEQLEKERF